ncbi:MULTISPECIES: 3-methyl-2-oxobutanoate hydroxymethyltransferase [Photorhabdus]|uniref:3-methyl-2-oxobutanoate hydroxymethyltransferase n=1 Tax=Photorhabdus TaxID=29487 RepID=UPI000AC67FC4|nr:3-methyl-2-oxobutanoate hydroxymethyltransferase [Photorhabdus thracensis]
MKEGEAQAVKLEDGLEMLPQVEKLVNAGIPVMSHIGFTPQAEHQLGGYRVQGKEDKGQKLISQLM